MEQPQIEVKSHMRVNAGPFGQTSADVHPDASHAALLLHFCVGWMVFKAILLS